MTCDSHQNPLQPRFTAQAKPPPKPKSDNIVARLYGLTDAERQIIEEKER